jgi:prolipoprotein diacylglyceryltransferase
LYILLAIATLFCYLWIRQFKEQLRIKEWMAALLALIHTVIGVLCVKAFAFLESGDGSGMSLYGAVFFLPIVYFAFAKLSRRRVADVFDVFTICTVIALLCARFNCILSGCCLGIEIPGLTGWRVPTREAELVFYIVLYLFFLKKVGKPTYRGLIYPIYMVSYGVFRFVVEFFRESTHPIVGAFHISHIWSILAIGVGCLAAYLISRQNKQTKDPDKKAGAP